MANSFTPLQIHNLSSAIGSNRIMKALLFSKNQLFLCSFGTSDNKRVIIAFITYFSIQYIFNKSNQAKYEDKNNHLLSCIDIIKRI